MRSTVRFSLVIRSGTRIAPKRGLWGLGALCLIVLVASGCGGVQKDADYKTASDLKAAAVKSGYSCPEWSDKDTDKSFDAGRCLSDNRDQFRVYPSEEAREKDLEGSIFGVQASMVISRTEGALLVGPNWTIYGPKDDVTRLKDKLGGYLPDLSDVRVPG